MRVVLPTHNRKSSSSRLTPVLYVIIFMGLVSVYMLGKLFIGAPTNSVIHINHKYCYSVLGYKRDVSGYQRAKCWANEAYKQGLTEDELVFSFDGPVTQKDYNKVLSKKIEELGFKDVKKKQSPLVYEGCTKDEYRYIGGAEQFVSLLQKRHGVSAGSCV